MKSIVRFAGLVLCAFVLTYSEADSVLAQNVATRANPTLIGEPQQTRIDTQAVQKNQDALIGDLNMLSAYVYMYRIKPKNAGGGQGSYVGFQIPSSLASKEYGSYESVVLDSNSVRLAANSKMGHGSIGVSVNEFGVLVNWEYSGTFRQLEKPPSVTSGENKDAIINDLNNLAAYSYQYMIRPKSMGGGEGAYTGLQFPSMMHSNANATYSVRSATADKARFMAISTFGYGVVTVEIDHEGRLNNWYYTDKFK